MLGQVPGGRIGHVLKVRDGLGVIRDNLGTASQLLSQLHAVQSPWS